MKYIKKIILTFLVLIPLSLNAGGLGIYVPMSFAENSSANYKSDYSTYSSLYVPDYTSKTDYKESAGIGFVFDTNVQKDKLFNYRLGVEFLNRVVQDVNGTACTDNCDYGLRVNIVNTFGFGIVRNENIRVWVGPRINIAYNSDNGNASRTELELGIAPVIGINVNLGKVISLSFDLDYRIAAISGSTYFSSNSYSTGSYSGTTQGATARLYLIFKIGDGFNPAPEQFAPSIEDDSL